MRMSGSRPLIYILRTKVPFQFLLWLLRIEKQTHAKVSDNEQRENANG
jgi:hypothetical protein